MSLKKILISVFAFFILNSVHADDYDMSGRLGLGIGAGGNLGLNDAIKKTTEEEFAAGLWFRYHLSSHWAFELSYDQLFFSQSKPAIGTLDLSLALRMWATQRFRFLFEVGAGGAQIKDFPGFSKNSYDAFAAKGRLGFEYMLDKDWALGLHADYHYADVKKQTAQELHILNPMLGLTYYFGGTSEPKDNDQDGVTDDLDKCPDTMAGVSVGADGCPLPDKKVVIDSDYDGVADEEDQCPGSPMGQPVNKLGCSAQEKLEFTLKVEFRSGKWDVDEKYKESLGEFADFMKKYPDVTAEIEGHTDNTGSTKFNYFISEKRATAVRIFLINNFAIDAKRLTS